MTTNGRAGRGVVVAAGIVGLLGVAVLTAAPASAADPLTASISCSVNGSPVGGRHIGCSAGASGGVAPYAFRWNGSTTATGTAFFQFCPSGSPLQRSVSVTVTDAAGSTASASQSVRC